MTSPSTPAIIDVKESGYIRSSGLSLLETYFYVFPGQPSDDVLLLFNVTKMKYMKPNSLKFYDTAFAQGDIPCSVYRKKAPDVEENSCTKLWRRKYSGSCLDSTIPITSNNRMKAISVTLSSKNQELSIEYKIVNCTSGKLVRIDEEPSSDPIVSVTTKTTTTEEDSTALPSGVEASLFVDWKIILLVVAFVIIVIAIVIITCNRCRVIKRKKESQTEREKEKVEEVTDSPIYEEVEEMEGIETYRFRSVTEPPRPTYQIMNDMGDSGYDRLERRSETIRGPSAPLPPPREGELGI